MKLKVQIIIVIILIGTITALTLLYKKERAERIRTEGNQTVLLDSISHYVTESGKNVATVGALNLKISEFKKYRSDDAATIADLNLKLKRVKSISNTSTTTKTKIKTVFRDRIVEVPGTNTTDTLRCIDLIMPYVSINGCLNQRNEFVGIVESRDTLTQVIHRVPKNIWFIKFGTKAIRQEVISMNPNTFVDFSEYIELGRK